MKTKLSIMLLAIAAAMMFCVSTAQAACKPKCPQGVSCRYDSTKKPAYWCDNGGSSKSGKTGNISRDGRIRAPSKETSGGR